MNDKKNYGTIRLPQELIENLKNWRQAFISVDHRPITYECILSGLLANLESERPDVFQEVKRLNESK